MCNVRHHITVNLSLPTQYVLDVHEAIAEIVMYQAYLGSNKGGHCRSVYQRNKDCSYIKPNIRLFCNEGYTTDWLYEPAKEKEQSSLSLSTDSNQQC